jgi:hypothetical protein
MLMYCRRSRLKVEGEYQTLCSFLAEDQMDFLDPLGTAVEDLFRNSATLIFLNEASLGP